MSDDIGVFIAGDRQLEQRFDEFPKAAYDALKERIGELTEETAAKVRAAVPRRTGRLASLVTSSVYATADRISGRVSVSGDFAKAGALEYGAHGSASVGAHEMRLAALWGRATGAPTTVMVPEHSRRVNIAAHRFMRGAAEEMRDHVKEELADAVSTAIEAGS